MQRLKKYIALPIIIILILLGFFIRIDYFLITPSRAVELGGIIEVENRDLNDLGTFYLVTVSQQRASLITALYGVMHPHIDLNPIASVIPANMDESEYRQLLSENMIESRHLAQVVALRRVGYEVEINSEGVQIVGLTDNAPAEGTLFENDLILAIDGCPVFLATEVPLLVQGREVGEAVNLTISRNGERVDLAINTGANPEDLELPYLGIYVRTLPWEPVLPVNIEMDTGRIGGPSAGLMFVLEIMNQLLEDDLTKGLKIAGTGTIDINENVGRIGGVVQKVITAERAGADYFLVPRGNYEQARKVARRIEVIAVDNLEEALAFLASVESPSF